MEFLYVLVLGLLLIPAGWVVAQTLRGSGDFGINTKSLFIPENCPNCNQPLPRVRLPKNKKEFLWGGTTCSHCGTEIDKWGKVRSAETSKETRILFKVFIYIQIALIALLIVCAIVLVGIWYSSPQPSTVLKTESPSGLQIEIVDTEAKRTQGLSGRIEVPDNYGMLFVFPRKDTYGFWMKDMHVSIDIIWLRDDGTIVGIEDSVSPDTYPATFYAPEPLHYVLETRAGYARDHGWGIGSQTKVLD